jgi:acetyl-CoA acetyltransferase
VSTLRGAAAIVGVTDAVSPTGELELTGRALEARMVKEALDDAGLALSDIDGVCHNGGSVQFAEFLGISARFTDSTNTGGSVFEVYLEHAASAIAAGVAECILVVFAQTPRASRRAAQRRGDTGGGRPPGGGPCLVQWSRPAGRVGGAVWPAGADRRVLACRQPPHGHLRHDP